MPVVQSIDGVFSLYQDRRNPQRHARSGRPKTAPALPDRTSGNPAYALAQRAYEKGASLRLRRMAVVAQDIMTSPVVTLNIDAPLAQAWTAMKRGGFRHLPVVDGEGRLAGLVSNHDLLHASHGTDGLPASPFPSLRSVMISTVITATPDTPILEIIEVMLHEKISAIPILTDGHRPTGILTTADILRALLNRGPLEIWT